jgi:tetratricopeptide (TPR) repeat protein
LESVHGAIHGKFEKTSLSEEDFAMRIVRPHVLRQIRFAVREATAFVGHSFAEEDERVVEQIKQFLSKLGVKCDSGKRPEPKGISDKVKERIQAAELFVGIFTRHLRQEDGSYSTSAWVVDEKATALATGKQLLLFVENGVQDFGGLQGDYEYIPFERDNLGAALIQAMDYVLAITSVPVTCRLEAPNRLHLQFGAEASPAQQIEELEKFVKDHPTDARARVDLAKLIGKAQDRSTGVAELRKLVLEFPNAPYVHHELAHALERLGDLPAALLSFQRALDLNAEDFSNHRCYGRCLQRHALTLSDTVVKRSSLEKARRLLHRAAVIGGQAKQQQIEGDLFVIEEALRDLGGSDRKARRSTRTTQKKS